MIEDVFSKRYALRPLFPNEAYISIPPVLRQMALIYVDDIEPALPNVQAKPIIVKATKQLRRELAHDDFLSGEHETDICALAKPINPPRCYIQDIPFGPSVDTVIKWRLSWLELILRYTECALVEELHQLQAVPKSDPSHVYRYEWAGRESRSGHEIAMDDLERKSNVVQNAISEMNKRLRMAGVPLHYHSGIFQIAEDEQIESHITTPFWSITSDKKWVNVDGDMKEAKDRLDTGKQDAALYATMALESTIKIISDEKGWTRNTEKGAADYINNLVSKTNGRFIEVWEADALKFVFSALRNPHGHGPGNAPQPSLSVSQTEWVIENCMSWIKSLIRRL